MKKFSKNFHQGYALIYTLLFIVLLLITVGTTWITGMADIRMQQRSEYSTEAYLLARSAVEDGWNRYKTEIGTRVSNTAISIPSNTCTNPDFYHRVDLSKEPLVETDEINIFTANNYLNLDQKIGGVYDFRVCSNTAADQIEGIGYYRGSKITLKGTITHPPGECITDLSGVITCDHSNDTIKIYQTGPS